MDVDAHNDVASQYGIRSVPTLMLFRNGEVLYRESGAMSKADLMALLDPFM
nr:thioredoxin family protein [uncultured Prevotella sp.]